MRSPTHPWAAVNRLFSTSTSQNASFKRPPTIQSLASAGRIKDAIRYLILRRHLGRRVYPECFVAIIEHSAAPETLGIARQLHAHMIITCFDQDPFICNHVIGVYGKRGFLGDAHWVFRRLRRKKVHSWNILTAAYCKFGFLSEGRLLFDEMPRRDAVSWNTLIAAYDQWGPCEEAIEAFAHMMRSCCKVDHFGVSSVISACANLRFVQNGSAFHGLSVKIGLDSHVQVGSAIIGLYSKCEQLDDARRIFYQMDVKEIFTWNSMLDGFIRCSRIGDAVKFFENMPQKDVVSWTTIMAGCSQHDRNENAIYFFQKMLQDGLRPDWVSFVSVLDACEGLLDLEEGSKIHAKIVKSGFGADRIVGSALVALYAKCGCLTDARSVTHCLAAVDDFSWSVLIAEYVKHGCLDCACELFDRMAIKTVPLWNALIGGYAEVGLSEEASESFKRMQMDGKYGDNYTFGSLLLSAIHLGSRFGSQLHSHIIKLGFDSSVFVASALINMYSTNSNCEAAVRIFKLVKDPNPIVWSSMISGTHNREVPDSLSSSLASLPVNHLIKQGDDETVGKNKKGKGMALADEERDPSFCTPPRFQKMAFRLRNVLSSLISKAAGSQGAERDDLLLSSSSSLLLSSSSEETKCVVVVVVVVVIFVRNKMLFDPTRKQVRIIVET
ncbi:Pentatricopeptide repeat-containing protein [Musa troglodytarum]|uniref:Pentatricopeptide repeat-containing protein n=1 Tax=Musa troglodytarum TaxID=320322 RepID=A0A9E7JPB3_9LILI|nr:Pentatricopeptide repeat-containing protein [Musa troglodytarum]